ncbi:UDP-2,3-diacylglucosamine diphosphatase [Aliikangiella sp. IMCC44359]|uniref:UDP-2,3-diacylglucosamine diphosphatase n=1 Tax=Aliikangiella sp. IMCC44359 TaxID=3459125 RepID=UPI00403B3385
MTVITHFISDLHLCETQPHLLRLFEHYMHNIAPKSQQLYVLGDLFEVWVGDDHSSAFNQQVINLFKHYTQHSGQLYVAHGNRDFLLGEQFAKQTGSTLIEEPYHLELGFHKTCVMHGDVLCTDDIQYQQFRKMVRNPTWQQELLAQSVEKRLAFASGVREKSKSEQSEKSESIMDVNPKAVENFFLENHCEWLIHGHTHREAQHQIMINDQTHHRIVLSDWGKQGHYLEFNNNLLSSIYFKL